MRELATNVKFTLPVSLGLFFLLNIVVWLADIPLSGISPCFSSPQDIRDGHSRKEQHQVSSTDPPWQITAPRQNEVVSEILAVYVRDAAPNQDEGAVGLFIDGNKKAIDLFSRASDLPPNDGVGVYVAHVFTPAFANGYHTLAAKDGKGNERKRRVFFDNFIHKLDWDSFFTTDEQIAKKDHLPIGFHLKASLKKECPWRVRIAYPSGREVYSTEGRSSRINISWDGRTTNPDTTKYEGLVCRIEIKPHPSRNLEIEMTKVGPK